MIIPKRFCIPHIMIFIEKKEKTYFVQKLQLIPLLYCYKKNLYENKIRILQKQVDFLL